MRGRIAICLLLIVSVVLIASPALAHVEVSPTELPESSSQELVFSYHHGCEGLATDALEVLLPEGVEVTSMGGPEGWQSTIEETEDGQVILWSGPAVPDGVEAEYPVELNLPAGTGATLYFPTIQGCGPDNEIRWIEIPAEGQDPEELAEPARPSYWSTTRTRPRPPPRRPRPPPRRPRRRRRRPRQRSRSPDLGARYHRLLRCLNNGGGHDHTVPVHHGRRDRGRGDIARGARRWRSSGGGRRAFAWPETAIGS